MLPWADQSYGWWHLYLSHLTGRPKILWISLWPRSLSSHIPSLVRLQFSIMSMSLLNNIANYHQAGTFACVCDRGYIWLVKFIRRSVSWSSDVMLASSPSLLKAHKIMIILWWYNYIWLWASLIHVPFFYICVLAKKTWMEQIYQVLDRLLEILEYST